MRFYNSRSIIVIFFYVLFNLGIIAFSLLRPSLESSLNLDTKNKASEFTEISTLDYFNLKDGRPVLSLSADFMISQNDSKATFTHPRGVYNYQQDKDSLRYEGLKGIYWAKKNHLLLEGEVKLASSDSEYYADKFDYFIQKDFIVGQGNVKFMGVDLKSKDSIFIESQHMTAHPKQKQGTFTENVKGFFQRRRKFEGKTDFSSQLLQLEGIESLAHLENDVYLKRDSYVITAGKADIYLENFNKSLKYFILNDDVKVTESVMTPKGLVTRKAFSERLEGFGKEDKMILSGAPRVETGSDVIKGYKITIRENIDLVEVDDAVSDVEVKKNEKEKNKN